jgi:hypothetical protein
MRKCANISPYMRLRRPLDIYDFATTILNFLIYEENLIIFFFISVFTVELLRLFIIVDSSNFFLV